MEQLLRELGFAVVPSQANFIWCTYPERPLQPVYEKLKASHVLVRYMNYPEWGEGLRISVGTDEQVDACVTLLKAILNDGAHGRIERRTAETQIELALSLDQSERAQLRTGVGFLDHMLELFARHGAVRFAGRGHG